MVAKLRKYVRIKVWLLASPCTESAGWWLAAAKAWRTRSILRQTSQVTEMVLWVACRSFLYIMKTMESLRFNSMFIILILFMCFIYKWISVIEQMIGNARVPQESPATEPLVKSWGSLRSLLFLSPLFLTWHFQLQKYQQLWTPKLSQTVPFTPVT